MLRTGHIRRVIAAVAVYAFFLQALLPAAFAIVAPADFAICVTSTADGSNHLPGRHDRSQSDCCSVMCSAPALATAPQATGLPMRTAYRINSATRMTAQVLPPLHRGPQSPRGPPAA